MFGSLFIGVQMPVGQIFILNAVPAILALLFISQVRTLMVKGNKRVWKDLAKERRVLERKTIGRSGTGVCAAFSLCGPGWYVDQLLSNSRA